MALIHTCYRITDVDRSVAFYEALGFQEVGRLPIKDEAVNVFMNQPGDGDMPRLELTYNFGVDSYEIGSVAKLDLYSLSPWRTYSSPEPPPNAVAANSPGVMIGMP
jgi:catechol 2,3-dioxygenase-like lactoylglutathione lyase family enzyme